MAGLKTFIFLGQSNMAGLAGLSGVPVATFSRWTGEAALPDPVTTSLPVDIQVPGIHMWQTQMPFATEAAYTVTDYTSTTQVTLTGITLGAVDQYEDRWCVVTTGTVGAGATQVRKITANTNVLNSVITIDGATPWVPQPTDNLRLSVLPTSHTLAGAQTSTSLTQSAVAPVPNDFDGATDVGKWVVVISGAGIYQATKITAVNSVTNITVAPALTVVPAAGAGIVILKGGGTQILSGMTGRFFPLNFYYGASPAYTTGYEYPNFHGIPQSAPILWSSAPVINPVAECSWQLRQYQGEDIWCIHLALGSSYISTFRGVNGAPDFSWFDNATHNDWHPGSTDKLTDASGPTYDLFDVLFTSTMNAAQTWVTANRPSDEIDVRGVFTMVGESEALDTYRAQLAGINMALIRDRARTALTNFSTLQTRRIPWIMGLVRATSSQWTYATTVNDQFIQLAADDQFTGAVNTDAVTVNVDGIHYNAPGQITFGEALADKWFEILNREGSPTTPEEERKTLSALRTLIKRRYERQGVSNDSTDPQVDMFLNDALREVYNTLGSNAWFLRRKEALTTASNLQPATFTLPRSMKELLYLEGSNDPGRKLVFKGVSRTDQGRQEIMLLSIPNGELWAHFMTQPRDLVEATDAVLLPNDYTELAVVLTCKRLAEAGGNAMVAGYYGAEIQRLWKYVKRDCLRKTRMYQESLVTVDSYDSWSNSSTSAGFREA